MDISAGGGPRDVSQLGLACVRRHGRTPASSMGAASLRLTAGASSAVARSCLRVSRMPLSSATCAGSARASLSRKWQQAEGLLGAKQVDRAPAPWCSANSLRACPLFARHDQRTSRGYFTSAWPSYVRCAHCGQAWRGCPGQALPSRQHVHDAAHVRRAQEEGGGAPPGTGASERKEEITRHLRCKHSGCRRSIDRCSKWRFCACP